MPLTVGNYTGDGVTSDLIDVDVTIPDSGTALTVAGRVQRVGQAAQNVASTSLTGLGVPGSGSNYNLIQVDWTSGAATIKTSSASMPTPDANNLAVFQQTIMSTGSVDLALNGGVVTPDDW